VSSVFSSLHESLRQVLTQRFNWEELREVQEKAYHAIHAGNDSLIIAPTAGGKSEAALIPVVDSILKGGLPGIACIYLSPLKALINDQEERFRSFCTPLSLSVMKWHGDVGRGERSWDEADPPHILMITPESLEVLTREKNLATALAEVRFIVVDELHAFVESDRGAHLRVLLDRMDRITTRKVQRIGLSATAGNPEEILNWLADARGDSRVVTVPAEPREKQFVFIIEPEESRRTDALIRLVRGHKALVFVNSRGNAEQLMQACSGRVLNLHIHHSSLSPATRKKAEEAFLSEEGACIICTSTLELGIDIGDLDVVVQVGPPNSVSSFLQRMGRGGRREKAASVAWVLSSPSEFLFSLAVIECAVGRQVEELVPIKKPYNVLIQQIFLALYTHGRMTWRDLVSESLGAPVFRTIDSGTIERVRNHLMLASYLVQDGEMVMPGPNMEREFFRSNGKDLYSVIQGGGECRAVTPDGDLVGNLDARAVRSASGEISLGGQVWSLIKGDEGHNLVVVVPGSSPTSRVFWTGTDSGGFSRIICRQVQRIKARDGTHLPLRDPECRILSLALAHLPAGVGPEGIHISEDPQEKGGFIIASMQGQRFNHLFAILLRHHLGGRVQVRYNDLLVKVSRFGKEPSVFRIADAIGRISGMTRDEIGALLPLPPGDSWKFAGVLPGELYRDMVISDHFHVEEFRRNLGVLPVSMTGAAHEEKPGD